MRILLAQKVPYFPAYNGAARVARFVLERLARKNHACRVVALADAVAPHVPASMGSSNEVDAFALNGVEARIVHGSGRIEPYFAEQIKSFDPDRTLICEDPTYLLLAVALESNPQKTVFLSQSQATLPFGPESFAPDGMKTEMLGRVAGICAISRYVQSYIRRWGGLESTVVPLPLCGDGPFPQLGSFDNRYVTMINPSAVKGVSIFLELAERFPDVPFAAVPTWATTTADRCRLEQSPNIHILEASEEIDRIFARTRILLVPSLWGEALGIVVVEAMLRGIPVLTSDVGGLPEAKLGIDHVLPVRPIESYESSRDDRLLPVPVVPRQDLAPWVGALTTLVSDRAEYDRLSAASRTAALNYVSGLSIDSFEEYLDRLPVEKSFSGGHDSGLQNDASERAVPDLSPEKLELLVKLLGDGKR